MPLRLPYSSYDPLGTRIPSGITRHTGIGGRKVCSPPLSNAQGSGRRWRGTFDKEHRLLSPSSISLYQWAAQKATIAIYPNYTPAKTCQAISSFYSHLFPVSSRYLLGLSLFPLESRGFPSPQKPPYPHTNRMRAGGTCLLALENRELPSRQLSLLTDKRFKEGVAPRLFPCQRLPAAPLTREPTQHHCRTSTIYA